MEITIEQIENALENSNYDLYGLPVVEIDGKEYAVAKSDAHAQRAAELAIEESLLYFTPEFLAEHSKFPLKAFQALANANEDDSVLYRQLIDDFDEFVEDAISCDGRGHFLSLYDGVEIEIENYYLYRIN